MSGTTRGQSAASSLKFLSPLTDKTKKLGLIADFLSAGEKVL